MRLRIRTAIPLQLIAGVLIGIGGTSPARAQPQRLPPGPPTELPPAMPTELPPALPTQLPPAPPPQLPPPAQPANPAIPAEVHQYQVFPDGGFPATPPAPEGGIPASTAPPAPGVLNLAPQVPLADYAPPGYEPRGVQQPPGVAEFFRPYAHPLPDYFYQQAYYDTPVTGPRTVEEYAPPGYEARDQQWGPGTPEFTPITPPPRISPEDRERFVTRGIMPGSFLVPATDTSFRLRGFVRLMGLYDFNPVGVPDAFVTNSIPVPQQHGENANFSARMSRVATETWTPTPFSDWTLHTYIEGDFFNGPGQAAGGGGNPFRLRHAFIDYGYFRVGQQNTVFMDASTWPSLVDFQGPAGWVNQRRPGARVTLPISDKWFWAFGVEQPFSDISTNGLGTNVQDVPDFATHVRYEGDFGHFQISGIARSIGFQPTNGETTRKAAYGLSLATTFHPWAFLIGSNPELKANPTALERCRLIGQYTFGWGIARYINDEVGLGLDGQVNPANGAFDLPYTAAYMISYEQWYTEKWLSNFTYSQTLVGSNGAQPGGTYTGAKYLGISLWYIPFANMSLGIEYLYGERDNLNEQRGQANRLNSLVQYNF
jgi:hypothetical protein